MEVRRTLNFLPGIHDDAIAVLGCAPPHRVTGVLIDLVQRGAEQLRRRQPACSPTEVEPVDSQLPMQQRTPTAGPQSDRGERDPTGAEIANGPLGEDFDGFTGSCHRSGT